METIYFTDSAIAEISAHLATHRPERGGALLGIPGLPVVTHYVADDEGHVTAGSYRPSLQGNGSLQTLIGELERSANVELKGVAHSHPRGIDRPSGQDAVAFADTIRLNP